MVCRNGDYPAPHDNEKVVQKAIRIGKSQSFLLVTYETSRTITMYIGGSNKWCINCVLIKCDNDIKQIGFLRPHYKNNKYRERIQELGLQIPTTQHP